MRISAYMIAHCDDDVLEMAISSFIDRVDELIFVDGAYAWVAPHFEAAGINPARSWPRTHQILDRFAPKVKYFSGVWDNELEKRAFGYAKCTGDVILRVDADEIFAFNDRFEAFLNSDYAVAEMAFPYLVNERLERIETHLTQTPKQVFAFRREAFSTPYEHLSYLWLVLTEEERKLCKGADWSRLFTGPVAMTAHVTAMRTPRTSLNRARFYTLQHIRSSQKLPFGLKVAEGSSDAERLAALRAFLSPEDYTSWLGGHEIVSGFAPMNGFHLAPVKLEAHQAGLVKQVLAQKHESMARWLDFAAHPRLILHRVPTQINITPCLKDKVTGFRVHLSEAVTGASGHLALLREDNDMDRALQPIKTIGFEGKIVTISLDPLNEAANIEACLILQFEIDAASKRSTIVGFEVLPQ